MSIMTNKPQTTAYETRNTKKFRETCLAIVLTTADPCLNIIELSVLSVAILFSEISV